MPSNDRVTFSQGISLEARLAALLSSALSPSSIRKLKGSQEGIQRPGFSVTWGHTTRLLWALFCTSVEREGGGAESEAGVGFSGVLEGLRRLHLQVL